MKKTILLLLFVTTPIVLTAQSLFDSLEDLNGVDMVVVTKDAFDLISKFKNIKIEDNEGMKVFEMIQDLKEFKMFSTNDAKVATIMGELVNASIKNQKEDQDDIEEEDDDTETYYKEYFPDEFPEIPDDDIDFDLLED